MNNQYWSARSLIDFVNVECETSCSEADEKNEEILSSHLKYAAVLTIGAFVAECKAESRIWVVSLFRAWLGAWRPLKPA